MSTETPGVPEEADAPIEVVPVEPAPAPACQNCGIPLLGPHCHACGQPEKGLVRHFSSVIGDFLDSALGFDSRTARTLWPLFARPGYLTCEYFEGRRVRYVSPVRLLFFLAIIAFFVGSLTVHVEGSGVVMGGGNDVVTLDAAAAGDAEAAGASSDAPDRDGPRIRFGDTEWDAETNPLRVSWLPDFANDWLNKQVGRAERNVDRLREEPDLYMSALMGAAPTTLLLLMPVFALMLKGAYLFKRRLYMEHLIVALHSHAFLCMALLLLFLLAAFGSWLPAIETPMDWLSAGIWIWMPIYLLLMQKRVYRQGWPATLLKYFVLGFLYMILVSIGLAVISLGSLVWM